jgi:hypothetical protein
MTLFKRGLQIFHKECMPAVHRGLAIAIFCAALYMANDAIAQQPKPSSCDPEIKDTMKARAWLGGHREFIRTKSVFSKPDSVFELTCFHKFLDSMAYNAERLFSETDRWDSVVRTKWVGMDTALTSLVGIPLLRYLTENFDHGFQNDRALDRQNDGTRILPGIGTRGYPHLEGGTLEDPTVQKIDSALPSNLCAHMLISWNVAKSMEFIDDPYVDGFKSLAWYAGMEGPYSEPRQLPVSGGVWVADATPDPKFVNDLRIAYNGNPDPYLIGDGTFAGYHEDSIIVSLDLLAPAPNCATPIPTGVKVEEPKISAGSFDATYMEHICANPGCYYVPSGANSGNCVP